MIQSQFKKLDGHLQEVLKGASSALLIRVLGTMLGFIVSVVIARWLGADGSGVYFLALSVVTIAATVGRLGFDNTVVRFIAAHASQGEWSDVDFVYRTAVKFVSFFSLLLGILMFFCAGWLAVDVFGKPFMKFPLQVAAVAVLPLSWAMIHAECLRGLKKIPSSQWIKTVLISLVCLLLLYPSISLWETNGAVISYTAAVIITAIVAWLLWKRVWVGIEKGQQNSSLSAQNLLQSSWPLFVVALAGLLIQQTATILLGIWGTPEDVGVFNVANRIASLLLFPLMAMISILAPKFSEIHRSGDKEGLKKLAQKSSRVLMLFAGSVALFVGMNAELILSFFGENFIEGAFILQVLLIGVVVNASAGAVIELLMMTGNETLVRRNILSSAGIQFLLCIILIPIYGMSGAACAVVIGGVLWNVWTVWTVKEALGYWPVGRGE